MDTLYYPGFETVALFKFSRFERSLFMVISFGQYSMSIKLFAFCKMSIHLTTLHNVCVVHRRICSTPGDVQYTRGYHWVHQGLLLVQWGNIRSTPGVLSTVEGYHAYTGDTMMSVGISWVQQEMFSTLGFSYKFNCFFNYLPPHLSWYPHSVLMISLHCTHDIPLMYWTSPSVLHRHYVSVNSKLDHPPGRPRGFAHSSCAWVGFALLCWPGGS